MEIKTNPTVELETIVSGKFATSGLGNFTAYSEMKNRYFVSKDEMKTLGIESDEDFAEKAPLYAITTVEEWNEYVSEDDVVNGVTDADGKPYTEKDVRKTFKTVKDPETGAVKIVTFLRPTASAIFTDRDKAIEAFTAKQDTLDEIAHKRALKLQERKEQLALENLKSKVKLDKYAKENELTTEKLAQLQALSVG